jgi:GNAT superfamily N-acetyltransferase
MDVRRAKESEVDVLAQIWYDGWQDAHAEILPDELKRARTLESFRERLASVLPELRVVDFDAEPVGFCIVKGDEVYQLYVAAKSRGAGAAQVLIADAESRIERSGFQEAWLACAIGNERAARFYEKCGWHRTGTMMNHLEIPTGTFLLEVWRYEKTLKSQPQRL